MNYDHYNISRITQLGIAIVIYLFKKNLFGKVIGQALESAEGDSSLIKCMIRKM